MSPPLARMARFLKVSTRAARSRVGTLMQLGRTTAFCVYLIMNKESKDKTDDERVRIPNARKNEDEKIAKRAKYEPQELSIVLPTAASRAFCRGTTYVVSGDGTIVFMHSGVLIWDDNRVRAFFKESGQADQLRIEAVDARFSLRWTGLTGKFVMAFT